MGSETILIVDDDDVVRDFIVAALRLTGFRTLPAASARAALELAQKTPRIDLAIIDLVMPEENGADLASDLKTKLGLQCPILYISGMGNSAIAATIRLGEHEGCLAKPFGAPVLIHEVSKLLGKLARPATAFMSAAAIALA